MAVTINGTTGITTPDITSDSATVDTTTLVVDETNNRVGIGTATPQNELDVNGSIRISQDGGVIGNGDEKIKFDETGQTIQFQTADSEAMRIASNGKINIGDVLSLDANQDLSAEGSILAITLGGTFGNNHMVTNSGSWTNNYAHFKFYNGNGDVGNITTSGSSTSFNTSSDYRLKENVVDMTGAIDRVKTLAPKRFNFIADDSTTVDGFLAHEAQSVVPEAVTGTHDEVDDDGNAVMQGIDQSKLVPLLTGALQEAIAKIETLETTVADLQTRVTALEAN